MATPIPVPIYVPLKDVPGGYVSTAIVLASAFAAILFAAWRFLEVRNIKVAGPADMDNAASSLLAEESGNRRVRDKGMFQKIKDISAAIAEGANAFLLREYTYMAVFLVLFSVVVLVLIGAQSSWGAGGLTAVAFVTGGVTSILSGYVGMYVAVIANSRTAVRAIEGYGPAFVTSFKAGMVMGFALVGAGVIVLYILINLMHLYFKKAVTVDDAQNFREHTRAMFEAVAGYGLGGSSVALFGRVGGGIYTKAADVGADLCGKLEFDIPEDDPRNPAVIADNVGDNVGDVAGMGADLFGSFAEATCAAMVISAQSSLAPSWTYMTFPILVTATGVFTCIVTSFVATNLMVVSCQAEIEPSLKRQIYVSTVLHTPVIYLICHFLLPAEFDLFSTVTVGGIKADIVIKTVKNWHVFFCIATGLWAGLVIGTITEYYTSHTYAPVREVAASCQTGAATNIIYGLALGFKSVIIPAFTLALTIYISFELARMYGIAMAALGILSTMSIGLAIDCYGPICDNAGGIAEMAGMGEDIRERTDALDAAGNTTAAIGKGFAIGSAALVSLALFGGFVTIVGLTEVDILQPFQFAGLLIGAMLPYWFSALTMKSVGKAALAMVEEVRRQFTEHPGILEGTEDPDYARCVGISTDASLREMLAPGALVMLTPLIVGFFVGTEMLAGVLAGALVSGVQMAISSANSGGAWDNAKKYVESGQYGGKGSDTHKAAVVGDTVGDPLKDTSGPSLNILIKLMAIISLVFASAFPKHGLLVQLFNVGHKHH